MKRLRYSFCTLVSLIIGTVENAVAQATASGANDREAYQGLLATRTDLSAEGLRVLMFSKTAGFRHASIPTAQEVVGALAETFGFELILTEDASLFSEESLRRFDVIVFASTTGDVLDAAQQAAMTAFIGAGGGYVGVHAASDTHYSWPWYGGLVGAYFSGHPFGTSVATLHAENPTHPLVRHLEPSFELRDEWYFFDRNPRGEVQVLLTLDERSSPRLANYPQASPAGDRSPDHLVSPLRRGALVVHRARTPRRGVARRALSGAAAEGDALGRGPPDGEVW